MNANHKRCTFRASKTHCAEAYSGPKKYCASGSDKRDDPVAKNGIAPAARPSAANPSPASHPGAFAAYTQLAQLAPRPMLAAGLPICGPHVQPHANAAGEGA